MKVLSMMIFLSTSSNSKRKKKKKVNELRINNKRCNYLRPRAQAIISRLTIDVEKDNSSYLLPEIWGILLPKKKKKT